MNMGACASRIVEVDDDSAQRRSRRPGATAKTDGGSSCFFWAPQTHGGGNISDTDDAQDVYCFDESKILGSGMSGQVVTMRHRVSGNEYAVKTLNIDQMGVDKLDVLRSEVDAMRRLDHPNIVKLYETFEEGAEIHMVMELCTGGVIVDRLERSNLRCLPEPEVAHLVSKLLSALVHCHDRDVLHRDIKLENLMYESTAEGAEVKLIDFGLSHLGTPETGVGDKMKAKGRVGTVSYMAPEVLRSKATRVPYAKPCDVWSLGVVTYMLLSGQRPFHAPKGEREREQKIDLILHSEPSFEGGGWKNVSASAQDLVRSLLQKDPEKRISARAAMTHEWVVTARASSEKSTRWHALNAATAMQHHSEVVWEIQAFSSLSRVHKLSFVFSASSAEVEELRQLFYAIDADGSGQISREEFKTAMGAHPEFNEACSHVCSTQSTSTSAGHRTTSSSSHTRCSFCLLDEDKVRAVFDRLDTDGDMIVSRDDLLRALESSVSPADIDDMFEQLGITTGKLFFSDLLRLMTEKDEATTVGVRRTSVQSKSRANATTASRRAPMLSDMDKSLSLADVVLASEAEAAKATKKALTEKPAWVARGRSIQDLSKFMKRK